jgi:hypothetical protein
MKKLLLLIAILHLNQLITLAQSLGILKIAELKEIVAYEVTGQINEYSFPINGNEIRERLGTNLSNTNDFGGVPGEENYDIFISDSIGNLNLDGKYITIECWYRGTSGGGGSNIAQVELKFNDGVSIPSSKLASFFSTGNNYLTNSELLAVDCKRNTWSTLGNISQNSSKFLRLTFSFTNIIKESNFNICSGEKFEYKVGNKTFNENNPKGVVLSSLANGCDKIEIVNISIKSNPTKFLQFTKCEGDIFSYTINGKTFNKDNPSGNVYLKSNSGCDTLLFVKIDYIELFTQEIIYEGCINENYAIIKGGIKFDQSNPSGTVRVNGKDLCDTIFNINMVFRPLNLKSVNYLGCKGDGKKIILNNEIFDENNPSGIINVPSIIGCDTIYTVNLEFEELPEKKTTLYRCKNDGFKFIVDGIQFDESNPEGSYKIKANGGCDTLNHLSIIFVNCDSCQIFAPNVLLTTSIKNNIFTIYLDSECTFTDVELLIFDRWGNNVYKGYDLVWDGTFKNSVCESGVYTYLLKYFIFEKQYIKNGTITLLK